MTSRTVPFSLVSHAGSFFLPRSSLSFMDIHISSLAPGFLLEDTPLDRAIRFFLMLSRLMVFVDWFWSAPDAMSYVVGRVRTVGLFQWIVGRVVLDSRFSFVGTYWFFRCALGYGQ